MVRKDLTGDIKMKRYAVSFVVEIDDSDSFNKNPEDWIYESVETQLDQNRNECVIDFICEEIL